VSLDNDALAMLYTEYEWKRESQTALNYFRSTQQLRIVQQLAYKSELRACDKSINDVLVSEYVLHIRRNPEYVASDRSCRRFWVFVDVPDITKEQMSQIVKAGDHVEIVYEDEEKGVPVSGIAAQKVNPGRNIPDCSFCSAFTIYDDTVSLKPASFHAYMVKHKLMATDYAQSNILQPGYTNHIKINKNSTVANRIFRGLKMFEENKPALTPLASDLLGQEVHLQGPGSFWHGVTPAQIQEVCTGLDAGQRQIFKPSQKVNPRLLLIQGPPGTGKTECVTRAVILHSKRVFADKMKKPRTLIVTPRCVAADINLERTAQNEMFNGKIGRFKSMETMLDDLHQVMKLDGHRVVVEPEHSDDEGLLE
jgi:hypothetical protein